MIGFLIIISQIPIGCEKIYFSLFTEVEKTNAELGRDDSCQARASFFGLGPIFGQANCSELGNSFVELNEVPLGTLLLRSRDFELKHKSYLLCGFTGRFLTGLCLYMM